MLDQSADVALLQFVAYWWWFLCNRNACVRVCGVGLTVMTAVMTVYISFVCARLRGVIRLATDPAVCV